MFRLDPGPGVEWYDVDYPDVIALRKKLFPTRPRYHLVATSATDPSWLDRIPADRPVLLLAEGISMYLTEREGVALLQRVVDRFRVGRTADRLLQLAHHPVAEDAQVAAAVRFDALLGRQQSGGHPGSSFRGSVADRRDVLRCDDFQPDIGCFPVGGAPGSCGPAAAPNTAIPPLRLRAR